MIIQKQLTSVANSRGDCKQTSCGGGDIPPLTGIPKPRSKAAMLKHPSSRTFSVLVISARTFSFMFMLSSSCQVKERKSVLANQHKNHERPLRKSVNLLLCLSHFLYPLLLPSFHLQLPRVR